MKQVRVALIIAILALLPRWGGERAYAAETMAEAAGMLVTAAPTPKDTRAQKLQAYLASYNSPLSDQAGFFVSEADRLNLDWKLVAAISGVESTFGKQIPPGSYNAWGWGVFTGALDGIHFSGWKDGITQVSEGLAKNYFGRGAKTIYDVGWIYAANGASWGSHVINFMNQIDSFTQSGLAELDITI